jgi:hypothetical protein
LMTTDEKVEAIKRRISAMREEAGPLDTKIAQLRFRLSVREGKAGYRANCAELRAEIAKLEALINGS